MLCRKNRHIKSILLIFEYLVTACSLSFKCGSHRFQRLNVVPAATRDWGRAEMYGLNLNRETRALALAHGFSKGGEFAFETAFAVAVVTLADADLLLIDVSYFFRYIPSVVFSPLGGWWADNSEKKCTLLAADLAKSLVGLVFFAV